MQKALIAPVLAIALATTATSFAATTEEAIEYRQSTMVMVKWNFKPMAGMVKGKIPFDSALFAQRADALATVVSLDLLAAFPKGSTDEFDSSAKEKIWDNWADFKKKFEKLRSESAKLARVAATGDEAAMKKQFAATAKSCKGCHKEYRSKK